MMLTVFFEKLGKTRRISTEAKTVGGLLQELRINPVTVIVSVNKEIVVDEARLSPRDRVEIFEVVSGG